VQTAYAREQMIEQQVRAWDVLDERVLAVLRKVPRELFVPQAQRYRAYADAEVPLARGQHMLRPSVFGLRDVEVVEADALQGDGGARYDVIALTASLPVYDARFERMLAVGGRLFVVVGEAPVMDARLVTRTSEDSVTTRSLFETVIDPLVNAVRAPEFTF